VQTVPWSSRAGDCPPDWPRALAWRLVQRRSPPVSGVDIEYSCAWCRGFARCRRIHPMLLRLERDFCRFGLHSHTVHQFFVAWHARAHFRMNLVTIFARSAIGFGHISQRRSASPLQYEARSDWGLVGPTNVVPIVQSARGHSMVHVAKSIATMWIWGPQDGLSIQGPTRCTSRWG